MIVVPTERGVPIVHAAKVAHARNGRIHSRSLLLPYLALFLSALVVFGANGVLSFVVAVTKVSTSFLISGTIVSKPHARHNTRECWAKNNLTAAGSAPSSRQIMV